MSAAEPEPRARRRPPVVDELDAAQRARRERIIAAALRLMTERDYDQIQMKDVTSAGGVALGTTYRYFTSKEHLFAEALVMWSGRFPAVPSPDDGGRSLDRLKTTFRRAVRAFERAPTIYGHMLAVQGTTDPVAAEVFDRYASSMTTRFADAIPRVPEPRRTAVTNVMSAVLDSSLKEWTLRRRSIEQVYASIDEAADLLLG